MSDMQVGELNSMDGILYAKDKTVVKKDTGSVYAIVTIQVGNIVFPIY